MFDYLLPLWPFLICFAWLFLGPHHRRRCPDCAARLPGWQDPRTKTARQWSEGGFICRQCGCEVDASGHKIAAVTPLPSLAPRRGSLLFGLIAGSAIILSAVIVSVAIWQASPMTDAVAASPALNPVPSR